MGEEGKARVGPPLSKFCMNDAMPRVRTQGSAAGSKQPHRKDKCSFYSKFQEQSLTCQLPINLYFCFGAPQPFLSLLCILSHSVETVPSESNKFYNIPSEKKNLPSPPLTPYTPPVIATICLLLSTVKFPQRFFYPNCLHFPHFQFTLQPVPPDFRCHHSSETAVVKGNNLVLPMQLPLFLPHLSESFERTDKLSTRTAFFYGPQDTTLS